MEFCWGSCIQKKKKKDSDAGIRASQGCIIRECIKGPEGEKPGGKCEWGSLGKEKKTAATSGTGGKKGKKREVKGNAGGGEKTHDKQVQEPGGVRGGGEKRNNRI